MFVDGLRGGGDGVLVGEDCAAWGGARGGKRGKGEKGGGGGGGGAGEDGGDQGEVVLVFLEVGGCYCVGAVERVEEGGVEGAEGEFVDYVGEIEF